ncbi:hypothetical protein N1031_19725 [Herbiconiux moechotypicola]|uniref:Peptidase C-terminal archaeal/bacterial domain-containing protein n=1 Tax=Herbiconiux moechotypicola TaxID=637393 RepID=A0ABN3E6J7_9MICO|nr:pre-peptidase C-terminal domain-containing protein [Herbiconiux moechotypicola]MCS5731991.1 hypothetical protein [Herbiconiux moechotypicola]
MSPAPRSRRPLRTARLTATALATTAALILTLATPANAATPAPAPEPVPSATATPTATPTPTLTPTPAPTTAPTASPTPTPTRTPGAPVTPLATRTEIEPNDTPITATALPLGDTVTGSVFTAGRTYEYDYYALDIPADGRLTLDLRFDENLGAGSAYTLTVLDDARNYLYDYTLDGYQFDGSFLRDQATFLAQGRYYVQLSARNTWASWGKTYTLTARNSPGLVETEFNSNTSSADALPLGKTLGGSSLVHSTYDYDYYALDAPAAGRLTLDFRFDGDLGGGSAYGLTVYDSSQNYLYSYDLDGFDSDGSFLRDQATYAAKGRYYVQIYGRNTWASWSKPYTLAAQVTPGLVETELNNNRGSADALPLGKTLAGSSLAHGSYDYDYYAVDVTTAGRLGIDFRFDKNLGGGSAYSLAVLDDAQNYLYSYDLDGFDSDGSFLRDQATFVAKGRYYVQIFARNSWASWGKPYSLTLTNTPGAVETEFNDTSNSADALPLATTVTGSSLIHRSYDHDYYAVDLPASGRVTLDFRYPAGLAGGSVYEFWVTGPTGAQLFSHTFSGTEFGGANGQWLRGQTIELPRGRSVITVFARQNWSSWGKPYSLTVSYPWKATPTPTISGTAKVGSTLTAKPGTWNPSPTLSYQWLRGGKPISGATKPTYTATASDAGAKLTVSVTGKKSGYTTSTKTSAAVTVAPGTLTATPTPTVKGTTKAGSTLTVTTGTWTPAPVTLTYQWLRGGKPISGATKSSYTLTTTDVGTAITVTVTGRKAGFTTVTKTSAKLAIPVPALSATPTPKISGTAKAGSTLTAQPGTWSPAPVSLTYQWSRNGKAITGATKSTYKLTTADAGTTITVTVTGKKAGYATASKTSAKLAIPLGTLTATPTPKISGTPKVGSTLTAQPGTWSPASVALRYQWFRNGVTISGATKSTYKAATADVGKKLTVVVVGSKAGYATVKKSSAAVTVKAK